jgi:hypothetical protein
MTDMNLPQVAGVGSLQDALKTQVKTDITRGGGSEQFLGYNSYSGKWTFGKDNDEIEPEDRLRIVPEGLRHGWHLWVDKKVTKVMSSVFKPMPEEPAAQTDAKGKLQQAGESRGMTAVLVDEEGDIQLSWEASTDGCRRAIDGVLSELMLRAQTEAEYLYPVVSLTTGEPYENSYKAGEMISPPRIDILGWCNQDGEDAPDAAPQIAKAEAKEEEFEPEAKEEEVEPAEENAPVRRRRQRPAA